MAITVLNPCSFGFRLPSHEEREEISLWLGVLREDEPLASRPHLGEVPFAVIYLIDTDSVFVSDGYVDSSTISAMRNAGYEILLD